MPLRRAVRVYAETSVFGGVFDKEFAVESNEFFREVAAGRFQLVVSPVVEQEVRDAPARVRRLFEASSSGASSPRSTPC